MKKVIILGGGLAGLICAIELANAQISCTLIEKKSYPFHRVCGEYISNETKLYLISKNLFPHQFNPSVINRLQLSSTKGLSTFLPLDLGGFGISRYVFDNFLYERAKSLGVNFLLNTEAEQADFENDSFLVKTYTDTLEADVVIGTFGKRSKLDVYLKREFIAQRSPYVGVKYHMLTDHPRDLISLHNFVGGYCGVASIEDNKTNVCYLTHRDNLKKYNNVLAMEKAVLHKNPHIKSILSNAEYLYEKPEVINEISFEMKRPVENHILMAGDSAGMITPLCGNGMAIAIHSAKILSEVVIAYCRKASIKRAELEENYEKAWSKQFSARLWTGRQIQKLFGSGAASSAAVHLANYAKPIANFLVRQTHGKTF